MNYRSEIDGLRAIAVISVVTYHAFPELLPGGFIGVDIFFVLSGFLISTNILMDLNQGTFSFSGFFSRRIRRLFPALLIVMTASIFIGWFILFADEFSQLATHIGSSALFVSNFIFANEVGYFDNEATTKPMLHLWSLAIEEQFYLLWPIVLYIFWRKKIILLLVMLSILIASFLLNISFVASHPAHTFFWPVGRFWELLAGAFLAWLVVQQRCPSRNSNTRLCFNILNPKVNFNNSLLNTFLTNIISLLGVGLLLYGTLHINTEMDYPSTWATIPVIGTCLIITSGSQTLLSRFVLSNPVSIWFGLISYPLYLWHWPLLSFYHLSTHNDDANLAVVSLLVLIAIFLAWLTFKYIEKPIRQNKTHYQITPILLALMTTIFTVSAAVHFSNGFPMRFDNTFDLIEEGYSLKCKKIPAKQTCELGNLESEQRILLYGDSHAAQLAAEIERQLGSDYRISVVTRSSCFMGNNLKRPSNKPSSSKECIAKTGLLLTEAQKHHYDLVITAQRWENYINPSVEGFIAAIDDRLYNFGISTDNFVIVASTTEIDFQCEKNNQRPFSTQKNCELTIIPDHIVNFRVAAQKFDDKLNIIYPNLAICDADVCDTIKEGKVIYTDTNHLSKFGSSFVIRDVIGSLKTERLTKD